ncbi:hypothetical protein GCM10009678_01140 [Actinomadura kijaniata]|uniref:RNA polymerase sigma-70 factor (ECF subfamily) n=1 Tax=Actinomadura namibiensis TaxID=182080 RepID=A0A7W3LS81_ACTNM|nr:RNA polymerase sigma factor [Actinomadura namibiensis]MBA8953358.1 RNA polymerase sigma-70 factor (ECF subfamily) [Actinomadura namibiensis]
MPEHPAARGWSAAEERRGEVVVSMANHSADPGVEFDRVFCLLLPRLYRRAVLLVGRDAAEDVVHEVYLKLRRRARRLVVHPAPYAYCFAAMVSVVRDQWRRDRRQVLVPLSVDRVQEGDTLSVREAELEVVRLLSGLTVKQAAAVLLVDLDGYTVDEAAVVLCVHRGTVARSRARALSRLRDALAAE